MLPGRLTRAAVVAAAVGVLAACGSADGTEDGALGDAVVEPGVTAIQDAGGLACSADADLLRTASEAYELIEGRPAVSEGALVGAGLLREESELWDVIDGQLVAQNPECGGDVVTTDQAATSAEPDLPTPEMILTELSEAQIAESGGYDCAYEIAQVGLALGRWQAERGVPPQSLAQVVEAAYLEPPSLWTMTATGLEPVAGSSCIGPIELLPSQEARCESDFRTLQVAIEAFVATMGAPPESERLLIEAGLMQIDVPTYDIVAGEIVPAEGSPCTVPPA